MRLCQATLGQLQGDVEWPGYDPKSLESGIVHLGIGAFHRAHQAVYTDDLLRREAGHWRIRAFSLRRASARDQLEPQDHLYTVSEHDTTVARCRLIASIGSVRVASETPSALLDAIADPLVKVLTLTVTEKGYGLGADDRLDQHSPEIASDLESGQAPRTTIGFLARGLAQRAEAGGTGLTLLSCDNLSGNGRKLSGALLGFLELSGEHRTRDWVEANCRFPSSMVDRIVPATQGEQIDALESRIGLRDEAAVFSEPYRQWVIEQRFAGEFPRWDSVGAEYVDDVAPFEQMKLRLLNASHSLLAWCGLLAGIDRISEAVRRPELAGLLRRFQRREAIPTLQMPKGYALGDYCDAVLLRFANPALPHCAAQIATDSSIKVTQRILPVLRAQLASNGEVECSLFALAVLLRSFQGRDEQGRAFSFDDPSAGILRPLAAQIGIDATREFLNRLDQRLLQMIPDLAERVQAYRSKIERNGVMAVAGGLHD